MRTTLTLEPDVAEALRESQRRSGEPFKAVVNGALRRGLALGAEPAAALPPFRVHAFRCGLRPGIDPTRLNQLADDLDAAAFVAEARAEPYSGKR